MTSDISIRTATTADLDTIAHLKSRAFGYDEAMARAFIEDNPRYTHKDIIVAEMGGQIVGTACAFRSQMWLSGVPIDMGAVAGVATHPDHQKKGVAKTMVTHLLNKMAADGMAISILFPSIAEVYHSLGYAAAAKWHDFSIKPDNIPASDESQKVRPFNDEDKRSLGSLYRGTQLSQGDGRLNRPSSYWETLLTEEDRTGNNHIVVYEGERLEGYLKYTVEGDTLTVIEIFASEDEAYHGLWAYLGSQPNIATIKYIAPPNDAVHNILKSTAGTYEETVHCLIRILNVTEALTSRFYPYGLMGNRVFKVTDPILPANEELVRFRIVDGRPDILPLENRPVEIETDIATLSQIFCGFITASAAQSEGKFQADESAVAWLDEAMSMTKPLYIQRDDWF